VDQKALLAKLQEAHSILMKMVHRHLIDGEEETEAKQAILTKTLMATTSAYANLKSKLEGGIAVRASFVFFPIFLLSSSHIRPFNSAVSQKHPRSVDRGDDVAK
jgi:hypothetical protein